MLKSWEKESTVEKRKRQEEKEEEEVQVIKNDKDSIPCWPSSTSSYDVATSSAPSSSQTRPSERVLSIQDQTGSVDAFGKKGIKASMPASITSFIIRHP